MSETSILIFGGTMEGRHLAEFCARSAIPADVCVVSQTGSDLIEERKGLNIHVGALDEGRIEAVLAAGAYRLVVDATHPYAKEATRNIRRACENTKTSYLRVKRESEPVDGPVFDDPDEIISFLNERIDADETGEASILSVLGGKSLEKLTAVHGFEERLWVRILPSDEMLSHAVSLGYPADHVIMEKGPFTVEQNLAHLRLSGAKYMITKESGKTGGYPQKAEAAARCGVMLLTLRREPEEGVTAAEAMEQIRAAAGTAGSDAFAGMRLQTEGGKPQRGR